jgi:hypothetical protein
MVGRPQWGAHKKGTHKGCPYGMARDLSMPSTVGATLVVALLTRNHRTGEFKMGDRAGRNHMVGRPQWGTRKKGTRKKGTRKKGTHKGCPYGMVGNFGMGTHKGCPYEGLADRWGEAISMKKPPRPSVS